jgi:CMP-N-acetylneuraminic acid synthetase
MKPYAVGFIFARGGSKGLPRKNVRLLAGKPLIAYAIDAARASKWIERVVVSTDDVEISQVAMEYGAEVPFMRPAELARDDSPEWLAWQHAIRTLQASDGARQIDVFVSIPTTSPLRSVKDLDDCIETLLESDADVVITTRPAERNPYFNMVALDESGYARLVIQSKTATPRRQDAPVVYDMTTVAYATRPSFVLNAKSAFEGKVRTVNVPTERAIDIDTEFDLMIAEFLVSRQKSQSTR